ncbi:MAG TPA: 6-hydroxymethylpterin diphosphokinase MptE-like protein [Rhabdochlamydiaceae bacterium]|nr:6-hydroxymethylpterin diphosphokinase MptE-like protein [Rhabdochlamydiaceae bacterium]
MSEVHCLYKWDEKKAKQYESWVKSNDQRFVLFLEDNPEAVILQTPHPRIRCISLPEREPREMMEKIVWEYLYLPFSFENSNESVLQQMASVHSEINFRAFDFADQGLQLLENFKTHLSLSTSLAKDLYGKFQNSPAIVCGGGPSLASCQSELKRLQDSALIIGCGAGVEALLKMGIKPHFVAHVDPAPLHKFTSTDIPVFYQLRTAADVVKKYKGRRLLVSGTGNFPLETWVQKKWGLEEVFDGGWTVGTFGAALALHLGCSSITLAGIDLATSKGQLYAPGVKTTSTADQFLPMKNREGESVLSRADWVLAAEWLGSYAKAHPRHKWGTLSRRGLEIRSIPLTTLEEISTAPGISELLRQALEIPLLSGQEIWKEIDSSFLRCWDLCNKILQGMEKIFPQNPLENGQCTLLEHDLTQELAYQQVLERLWTYWQHVISRHNMAGEWGLYLNRILFFQALCEKIDAI